MKQNTETQFVDFDPAKAQLDAFTADAVNVSRKLDADQYTADDIDGGTEDLFGSGNLNYLTLQMGQTNDLILSHSPFQLLNQNDASFFNQPGISQSASDLVSFLSSTNSATDLDKDLGTGGGAANSSIGNEGFNTSTLASISASEMALNSTTSTDLFSTGFNGSSSDQSNFVQTAQNGTNGTNGMNGMNGNNGTNGSNGNNGSNGTDGTDGNNGNNGNPCNDDPNCGIDIDINIDISHITNLLEQIIQLVTHTINHITNVTEHALDHTVNIIDVVTDGVGETIDHVTDTVDNVLDSVGNTTGDIINHANDTVDNLLNCTVDQTVDEIIDTLNGILSHIPLVDALPVSPVLDGVSNIVDDVTNVATETLSDVTGIVDNVVSNITDNTGDIVATVGDTVDTLLNETVDDTADALLGTVGDVLNGDIFEGNVVENIIDSFDEIIPDVIDTLGDTTGEIVGDVASIVDGITEVVTEDVTDTLEKVIGGVGDVTETLADILNLGAGSEEGTNDYDLLVDVNLGAVGTDLLDVDIDAVLDPVEDILGDIDIATDAGIDLFGGETDNQAGDTDILVDLGITGLDLDLDIPLNPIENIIGDIDLSVGSDIDLLGLGTDDGLLDVLGEVISWPETTIQNVADNLLGGDELGGGLGALLPDPVGDIVEGLGILDVGGHSGGGGGGLLGGGGLFGGGLFG